ncbi:MAG: sulfite exporter TauE/SafE family protein, partial [Dehalococcoidia bacterium]|nr:sulfite exporter TauE/SafE family protein [Dehalococcoidia bacterium]
TGGLLVFGVPPLLAVGTGLTLIMGSSIINTLKHGKEGNVDFRLGALMVVGTIPAVVLAERVNSQFEAWGVAGPVIRYVYVVFLATLVSFILYDYWKTRRRAGTQEDQVSTASRARSVQSLKIPPHSIGIPGLVSLPTYVSLPTSNIQGISIWVPIGVGFGVGFMAGLLGAGGGFILMPILIFVLGIPTVVAVGTDLFQVVITGSVGTLIYSLSNNVDLLMAVIMLATASIGSQLGVVATRYVEASSIRSLYGVTVLGGCVAVALKQVSESSGTEFFATLASILLLGVAGLICVIIATMMMIKARNRETTPTHASGDDTG